MTLSLTHSPKIATRASTGGIMAIVGGVQAPLLPLRLGPTKNQQVSQEQTHKFRFSCQSEDGIRYRHCRHPLFACHSSLLLGISSTEAAKRRNNAAHGVSRGSEIVK